MTDKTTHTNSPANHLSTDFSIADGHFMIDGKPYVIRAGELHFSRIPRPYWDHRIKMVKAMGMNTICIYLFWNYFEGTEGTFDFSGERDIAEAVRLIQANGMYCILRPGPYSCAEWDMGGYPWWLLRHDGLKLRSRDNAYFMEKATAYLRAIGHELAPYQLVNGGNILMVQVENEYACYGTDSQYVKLIRDALVESGFDRTRFFRCDWSSLYNNYELDNALIAINFGAGADVDREFLEIKRDLPDNPLFCSEYWTGWFDHWGKHHETRGVETFIGSLKDMMDRGISFSLYMAHGGTSFGYWGGASSPPFSSMVTSYDYDAPVSEQGRVTEKFFAIRNLLKDYLNDGEQLAKIPEPISLMTLPEISFTEHAAMLDAANLPQPILNESIRSMEHCGQGYGCILYRTELPQTLSGKQLHINHLHDWARVFINGADIAILERRLKTETFMVPADIPPHSQLDILVDAEGRVNFGMQILDHKGITESVTADDGISLSGWQIYLFPADYKITSNKIWSEVNRQVPGWHRATFRLSGTITDTYLDCSDLGKGMLWINGFNLGRFNNIGPQQTLYLPGCYLKQDENEILILDLLPGEKCAVRGLNHPIDDDLRVPEVFATHRKPGEELDLQGYIPIVQGEFPFTREWQTIRFAKEVTGKYICLEAVTPHEPGSPFASAACLELIGANGKAISPELWQVLYADSEEVKAGNMDAEKLYDGQNTNIWHTATTGDTGTYPHSVVIDLGQTETIYGFRFLPRQDKNDSGRIKGYRFYVSSTKF